MESTLIKGGSEGTVKFKRYNNLGETKMDNTERKERLEEFKKEELFLSVCADGDVYVMPKIKLPTLLQNGARVFRLDGLKEVTKADVVVE